MLSKVTLANGEGTDVVIHEDSAASKRQLIDAKGLVGIGALRESKRVRPQAHGSINETQFEEGRTIQLTGEVMSQSGIEDALVEFRKISGVLLESLDNGGALMKWTEGTTGLKLQQLVQLDSEIEPTLQEAAAFLQYPVSLFAEDPRAYSQTLTTQTGASVTIGAPEQTWVAYSRPAGTEGSGMAVDSSHVYWANSGGYIGRAAIGGGTVEPEWLKTGAAVIWDVAVDASHIYWATGEGGMIGRAAIGGTTIEKEWIKVGHPAFGVAVSASRVYIRRQAFIARASIGGVELEPEWIPGIELYGTFQGIAVDSAHVYFVTNNAIGRATITGGTVEKNWITGASEPDGIAADASFVYWTNRTGNTIGRATIAGTEVNQSLVTLSAEASPRRLAINSERIFWQTASFIGRSVLAGALPGSTLVVAQAGNRPAPVTFKIHGPITDPALIRSPDGSRISLAGTVGAGNYVEVNPADRTVKLNGLSSALGMLNPQATNWEAFVAPPNPRSVTYQLTASSATAAFMDVLYRSAYA